MISNHTAIILIALGGPRNLDEVGPFMAAFMGRPAPPPVVAAVIERYKLIGGKSPLPEIVQAQAAALEKELGQGYRAYEGFRYSKPTVAESFDRAVKDGAERVIASLHVPFCHGGHDRRLQKRLRRLGKRGGPARSSSRAGTTIPSSSRHGRSRCFRV